jgi:8-oxo-dGTP pyrophosphatase MutT (NUDIX family)
MANPLWASRWLSVEREGDGDEFFAASDEVLIVARDTQDNVLLIEEPSPAFGERALFLPGGAVEPAERIVDAAQRELREETGYRAATLELVASLRPWPKYLRVTCHIVRAAGLDHAPLEPDEPHQIIVRRMRVDAICEAISRGEITDARVAAALAVCF